MKTLALGLVLGLAVGMVGGYFGRPRVERALGGSGEVEALVVAERQEEDRLVLTLSTGDETMLASFRERQGDVAELVSPGDMLTVRIARPGVFADDVPIVRLRRAADAAPTRGRRRRRGHEEEQGDPEHPVEEAASVDEAPAAPSGDTGVPHLEGAAAAVEARQATDVVATSPAGPTEG